MRACTHVLAAFTCAMGIAVVQIASERSPDRSCRGCEELGVQFPRQCTRKPSYPPLGVIMSTSSFRLTRSGGRQMYEPGVCS